MNVYWGIWLTDKGLSCYTFALGDNTKSGGKE
jgi:hypothetical protein